jgi:hypothetical protein
VFRSCRSSRLQRFPPQRADPKTRPFDSLRVCCTPQPAMGFTTFRTPWLGLSAGPRPEGRGPHGPGGVFPSGEYPSKRSPPRQPSTMPSPRLVLSDSAAYTGWRALSPFRAVLASVSPRCAALLADLRAFFRRGVRCGRATFPLRARSMLPWALDRLVSDAAARFAPPRRCWTFRLAGHPLRRPRPERQGKARCFGLVWLRATAAAFPEGRPRRSQWLRHLPKEAPRPHPTWAPKETVGCRWISPKEDPPRRSGARRRRVADVIATHLRRDSCATQCSLRRASPVVRASAPRPLALARVHDGEPARRGRPHPEVGSSARHSRAPRRTLRSNPAAAIPKDSDRWASRGQPEGSPLAARGSGVLQQAGGPVSGQTIIVITGTAGLGPEGPLPPPIRRMESGAEAPGCGWWPHIPHRMVIRRGHRSARAEMDRSPSRAFSTEVETASVPSAPKRFRNPDRCNPDGR